MDSLLKNETGLKSLARAPNQYNVSLPPNVASPLTQRSFWEKLESLWKILSPVKTMMDLLEANDSTMADVFSGWVVLGACIAMTTDLPSRLKSQLISFYNTRFQEMMEVEAGIILLAFFMHPMYHKKCLKSDILQVILKSALGIWKKGAKAKNLQNHCVEILHFTGLGFNLGQ
jgi:hypothetical protein